MNAYHDFRAQPPTAHMLSFTLLQHNIPGADSAPSEVSRLCGENRKLRSEIKRLRESDSVPVSQKRCRMDETRLLLAEVGMQRFQNVYYAQFYQKNHGVQIPQCISRMMEEVLHSVLDEVLASGLEVLEIMNGALTEVALEQAMRNVC